MSDIKNLIMDFMVIINKLTEDLEDFIDSIDSIDVDDAKNQNITELLERLEKLEKHIPPKKKVSKKEIGNLKRKLTNSKKKTQKMQDAYDNDEVESAEDFLKKFANK